MEYFVIIVNGWKPLTIIAKHSILDIAAVLDPPLICKGKEVVKSNPLVLITLREHIWETLSSNATNLNLLNTRKKVIDSKVAAFHR